jgi:hypothetical protein
VAVVADTSFISALHAAADLLLPFALARTDRGHGGGCGMRRVLLLLLTVGLTAGVGCQWNQAKKFDMTTPKVESFDPPPDEPRYNSPPEVGYRKPPVSKDMASRPGAMGGGPVMMNGGPGGQ